jgi:hypothetical protein
MAGLATRLDGVRLHGRLVGGLRQGWVEKEEGGARIAPAERFLVLFFKKELLSCC